MKSRNGCSSESTRQHYTSIKHNVKIVDFRLMSVGRVNWILDVTYRPVIVKVGCDCTVSDGKWLRVI